tara:strand:+ start:977 stop:1420 length:444 start_codon:yes stop_codon:yes gene_type:complete
MEVNNFLKKYKIKKVYSYHEEKIDDSISFGWRASKEIDLDESIVVSTMSKSKKASENDIEWSRREGNSAATLVDYTRYFEALTGGTPDDFVKAWESRLVELEDARKRDNQRYREGEGEFLLSLAKLLSEGKKFSKFGRVYKIVSTNT